MSIVVGVYNLSVVVECFAKTVGSANASLVDSDCSTEDAYFFQLVCLCNEALELGWCVRASRLDLNGCLVEHDDDDDDDDKAKTTTATTTTTTTTTTATTTTTTTTPSTAATTTTTTTTPSTTADIAGSNSSSFETKVANCPDPKEHYTTHAAHFVEHLRQRFRQERILNYRLAKSQIVRGLTVTVMPS